MPLAGCAPGSSVPSCLRVEVAAFFSVRSTSGLASLPVFQDHRAAFFRDHVDRRLVFPEVILGIIDASITLRPSTPLTRRRSSTTAIGSLPILHVPTGWKIVVPARLPPAPAPHRSRSQVPAETLRARISRAPGGHDAPRISHRIDCDRAIFRRAKVIQLDLGIGRRIRRHDAHPSARQRAQIAHARRDRGERVQRIAELVERERLDVPFDIGRRLCRHRSGRTRPAERAAS